MHISLIAALDRRGLIGTESGLPWKLPRDLQRFRANTWGKPILMGRSTFASIGKPLPGRCNIVLTQNPEYRPQGCRVAHSFQEALSLAEDYLTSAGSDEVMVIGGGKVYAQAIHHWDRMFLTVVEGQFQGTTFFPLQVLLQQSWRPVGQPEVHLPDERNPHPHSFHILERVWETNRRSPPVQEALPAATFVDPNQVQEDLDLAAILARGTMLS